MKVFFQTLQRYQRKHLEISLRRPGEDILKCRQQRVFAETFHGLHGLHEEFKTPRSRLQRIFGDVVVSPRTLAHRSSTELANQIKSIQIKAASSKSLVAKMKKHSYAPGHPE